MWTTSTSIRRSLRFCSKLNFLDHGGAFINSTSYERKTGILLIATLERFINPNKKGHLGNEGAFSL
jgi:hypothetical protein